MNVNDLYSFQTTTGIIVPKTDDVKSGWEEKFKSIFGSDLDVSETTLVGRLIEALTVLTTTTCGVNAQNANQFNIHFATGSYLDSLGKIYGVPRDLGTKTRAEIIVRTSVPVTIPAGSLVMASKTYALFSVDSDIAVDTSLVGRGIVTAVDYGPIPADPHTITKIQTGTLGWISVDNESYLELGKLEEDDDTYRARIIASRATGTGFLPQMTSALKSIDGIKSVCILENNNLMDKIVNGVPVTGHSIFICIDGITSSNMMKIADAIARVKPAGTGMVKDQFVETAKAVAVVSSVGNTYYVYNPVIDKVKVYVNADVNRYLGVDAVGSIKKAVLDYFSGLSIGESVFATALSYAITDACTNVICKSVKLTSTEHQDMDGVSEVNEFAYQKANVVLSDIEVDVK